MFDPAGPLVGQAMNYAMALATGTPSLGPVMINGMPATNAGTESLNSLGAPHILLRPGTGWAPIPKAPKPAFEGPPDPPGPPVAPEGDAVHIFGSQTVNIMGASAVRMGDPAMRCSEPVRLPSSAVLAIPKGAPGLIGGPPSVSLMDALGRKPPTTLECYRRVLDLAPDNRKHAREPGIVAGEICVMHDRTTANAALAERGQGLSWLATSRCARPAVGASTK